MTEPVKIIAILDAHAGHADALRDLLTGMLAPSRAEPGNLRYDLWQDPAAPGRFVLDELYADAAAVTAHRGSAHFQHYLATIGDLATRSALVLAPVALA